ncbi:unnamed protein product [Mytilus coruscus]|uniref:DDE-1 domain-containing protein n=1 Tax=Mytilus coruscus TaxID=42192 RepID=A0A6J8CAK7_MYTCO|nr:unnamed protein product [Mytilus coruscus]
MVRKVIRIIEASEVKLIANALARKLTLVDAVHLLQKSWNCVITVTIINCFKKGGFVVPDLNLQEEQSEDDRTTFTPPEMTDVNSNNSLTWTWTSKPWKEQKLEMRRACRQRRRRNTPSCPSNFIRPPECTVNNSSRRNTVQHMMLAQTWVSNLMVAGLPDQNQMPELEHVNDPLNRNVSPELVHVQMLLQRAEEQMIQPPPYS